jgi:hypothetical protein
MAYQTTSPPAQQEPGRFDLNRPETYSSNPSDHALSRS